MNREDALLVVRRLLAGWGEPVVGAGDQERWLTALTADKATVEQVNAALDAYETRLQRPTIAEIRDRVRRDLNEQSNSLERNLALDPGVIETGRTHIAQIRARWTASDPKDEPFLDRLAERGVLSEAETAFDVADAGGNPCPDAMPVEQFIEQAKGAQTS